MVNTFRIMVVALVICFSLLGQSTSGWQGHFTHNGLRLTSPSGSLSSFSRVIAVEPPWKQLRLYTRDTPLKSTTTAKGKTKVVALESINKYTEVYLEDWSLTTAPDHWLVNVDLRQNGAAPTKVEYVLMTIPQETLLEQGDLTWVDTTYREHRGKLGAPQREPLSFLSIDIPTVFGVLSIRAEKGTLSLHDRRIRPFEIKCMWIGVLVAPISKDAPFQNRARISLRPYENLPQEVKVTAPPKGGVVRLVDAEAINRLIPDERLNIPVPKRCQELPQACFKPGKKVTVSLPTAFQSDRLRRGIVRTFRRLGLDCAWGGQGAEVTVQADKTVQGHDAYGLTVGADGVVIRAAEEPAVFYAFQTLAMRYDGKAFAGCVIEDCADFKVRGMHLIPDSTSMQFHAPLFEKVLAPLKINQIIMESQYVKWEATRDFHHPRGMDKEDLKKLLKIADDNYIRVIPQIQTFGHSQWLFYGGKNKNLADNPERPVDYNVANPKTYELIERILDEAVETFKANAIHIGHDEITMVRNKKAHRKELQDKPLVKILEDDFRWYYDYASKRKLRLMYWHDMLMDSRLKPELHGYGLPALRELLPSKNVTICYWDYSSLRETFPAIDIFKKLGFEVWPVAWYHPNNIENLSAYAKSRQLPAMMTSTWAGYFRMDTVLQREYRQISAYVRLAAYAWNSDRKANQGHDYDQILLQLWNTGKPQRSTVKGRMVKEPQVPLVVLSKENNPFKTGHCFGLDKRFADETTFCGDIRFMPFKVGGKPAAMTLASTLIPHAPKATAIRLGQRARALYFLQTVLLDIPLGIRVATCHVTYEDGTQLDVPIRYGTEINSPTRDTSLTFNYTNSTKLAWGQNRGRIGYCRWQNPHPDKVMARLTFDHGNVGYPFWLLGLSLE